VAMSDILVLVRPSGSRLSQNQIPFL
jgi:hypothetical protein